jgi:hypothetical protein
LPTRSEKHVIVDQSLVSALGRPARGRDVCDQCGSARESSVVHAVPCRVRPAAKAIVVSVAATALGGVDPAAAAYQVSMYSDA